jgi:1-acylglycerone phosphate reductase
MISRKSVFITGCSEGGYGEALTKVFQQKGYHVFATVRDPSKAGAIAQLDNVDVLTLEVTSTESVQQAAQIVAKATNGTLDVLINNAARDFVVPLLDVSLDEAKKLYDVNVWGILATTQAFAPMLIKAKGTVCNMTSTAACMPFAYGGM